LPGRDKDITARLSNAGLALTPIAFRAEQISWAMISVGGTAGLSICAAAAGIPVRAGSVPLLALLSGLAGYFARDWWLGKQSRARLAAIKEELPTALDMLALALIAGESAGVALQRVAVSIGGSVGREFDAILADVRAGEMLVDALERGKERTSDPAMARFLDSLATGIEKGAPLAETLRAQADDARHARGRELLEAAGRKEVLMLVPVVFLIMPVVVVYALFPGLASLDLLVG
jgi:tight adherence protein C